MLCCNHAPTPSLTQTCGAIKLPHTTSSHRWCRSSLAAAGGWAQGPWRPPRRHPSSAGPRLRAGEGMHQAAAVKGDIQAEQPCSAGPRLGVKQEEMLWWFHGPTVLEPPMKAATHPNTQRERERERESERPLLPTRPQPALRSRQRLPCTRVSASFSTYLLITMDESHTG